MNPYSECLMKKLTDCKYQIVVVPSSGIKTDVSFAYNHLQNIRSVEDHQVRSLPKIRTFEEHIVQVWNRARNESRLRDYRLLDQHEFRYLWMKAGLKAFRKILNGKGYDPDWITGYISDICDESIRFWQVINDYEICTDDLRKETSDGSLQSCFAVWIEKYMKKASKNKWLSRVEMMRHLRTEFENSESKRLFVKYEKNTLFVTLSSQKEDYRAESPRQYVQYIRAATKYGGNVEKIELKRGCDSEDRNLSNLCGKKFEDTNQEAQAAAAWARNILEKQREQVGDELPRPPRIGIVVPSLGYRGNAIERQFLTTFCPDGHRVWQTPRFTVGVRSSITQTPIVADVLSYIRARHAKQIEFSEAKTLTKNRIVPKNDEKIFDELTKTEQAIDSSLDSPWKKELDGLNGKNMAWWMSRFRCFLKKCKTRLDSRQKETISQLRKKLGSDLDFLFRTDCTEDLLAACRKFEANAGAKEGRSEPEEKRHAILLSRLEESVAISEDLQVLDKLCEMSDYLTECATQDERGNVKFNAAYAYFSSACLQEQAATRRVSHSVEILAFQQAVGRHFTHLWIMGMRDTDWPPRVSAVPLVDLRILRKSAPEVFEPRKLSERAEAELLEIISFCGNSSNTRVSYAVRDSGGDREYLGAGSMFDEAEHDHEEDENSRHKEDENSKSGSRGIGRIGHHLIKWGKSTGSTEGAGGFHPFYQSWGNEGTHGGCTEPFNGQNDDIELPYAKRDSTGRTQSSISEFATQFECPFKAFSVHRLQIERPPRRFGSLYLTERMDEVRKLVEALDKGEFPCIWKKDDGTHYEVGDISCEGEGIYRLKDDKKNWDILADFTVGIDGGCDTVNVKFEGEGIKLGDLRFNAIAKDSFRKFCDGERLYPLKVLICKVKKLKGEDVVPAYMTGADLRSGRLFRIGRGPIQSEDWEKVGNLIDKMEKNYRSGKLNPAPIGYGGEFSNRLPEVCRDCHLRSACRFHHTDESLQGGQ